jgi:hypothetical protein
LSGAPWSILPLWLSTNLGYRFFARHLPSKSQEVFRDDAMLQSPDAALVNAAG